MIHRMDSAMLRAILSNMKNFSGKIFLGKSVMQHAKQCIDLCNRLLCGERSAVETYEQVIRTFQKEPGIIDLQRLLEDHETSVQELETTIREMGGNPSSDAGPWGTFAIIVEGSALFFGKDAAVSALALGERHGKDAYEKALSDEELLPNCKRLLQRELLPRQKSHVAQLETLEQRLS